MGMVFWYFRTECAVLRKRTADPGSKREESRGESASEEEGEGGGAAERRGGRVEEGGEGAYQGGEEQDERGRLEHGCRILPEFNYKKPHLQYNLYREGGFLYCISGSML
eukprot:143828-Rhodomonas_salina.2